MKFEFDRSLLIRLGLIGLLLFLAPWIVPFTFELILVADFLGLEALFLFLIYQLRHILSAAAVRLRDIQEHFVATFLLLASGYVFQPKICLAHATGSSLLLVFTCSAVMALALWVPAVYLSLGGFT